MIKHKCIRLEPSHWYLDVVCGTDVEELNKFYKKRYGLIDDSEYCQGDLVTIIHSDEKSQMKGESIILMKINYFKKNVIVHEIIHVLHYVSKYAGLEINWKSQEWQACFVQNLFTKICEPNYKIINKNERKERKKNR